MKKITFSIFLLVSLVYVNAQNCTKPIPNIKFQQLSNQINRKATDSEKLTQMKKLFLAECLSSDQVDFLCKLFENDYSRFEFASEAYKRTFDKDNFYEVYDSFMYFSTVFRLHDAIKDGSQKMSREKGGNGGNQNNDAKTELKFPNYTYPNYLSYTGSKGCAKPISNDDFNLVVQSILELQSEQERLVTATEIALTNCLSAAQAMKTAAIFPNESTRLAFIQEVTMKVYDRENLRSADQLFTTAINRNALNNFLDQKFGGTVNAENPATANVCMVSNQEFISIESSLKSQSFNNTRVNLGKQIIKDKACFTSAQIRDLVKIYEFENSKLDIAKFAYDYCVDKKNYYLVNEAFQFDSSKNTLLKFIQGR